MKQKKICPYASIQQKLSCSPSVLGVKGQVINRRWGGPGGGKAGILPWANVSTQVVPLQLEAAFFCDLLSLYNVETI